MFDAWIAVFTLFIITLGFAGMLGDLIFHLRTQPRGMLAFFSLMIGSLVFFPPLSLPGVLQWPFWLVAGLVSLTFAVRPASLPRRFHSRRFILRYACLSLVTTALWYLSTGTSLFMLSLTALALLAALISWRESLEW